jgi:hypothetical protein
LACHPLCPVLKALGFLPFPTFFGDDGMRDLTELVKLYLELFYLLFYPALIIIVCVLGNFGVYSWLVIGLFLAPQTLAWFIVVRRRILNYLRLLLDNKPKPWNIEKAVEQYKRLLVKNVPNHDKRES